MSKKYEKPLLLYGQGPEGKTCETCANCVGIAGRKKNIYKCAKWLNTCSSATDIRLKWPACGMYVEVER